jgi:hypothetical protein
MQTEKLRLLKWHNTTDICIGVAADPGIPEVVVAKPEKILHLVALLHEFWTERVGLRKRHDEERIASSLL